MFARLITVFIALFVLANAVPAAEDPAASKPVCKELCCETAYRTTTIGRLTDWRGKDCKLVKDSENGKCPKELCCYILKDGNASICKPPKQQST
ncbi:hypothetical protein V8E55_004914 [Tylopilus felleus]